jgi:hypothetical protein
MSQRHEAENDGQQNHGNERVEGKPEGLAGEFADRFIAPRWFTLRHKNCPVS